MEAAEAVGAMVVFQPLRASDHRRSAPHERATVIALGGMDVLDPNHGS